MGLFDRPIIPRQPEPEPPGFNLLRDMMMRRIFEMNANPYGMNPNYSGPSPFNPQGRGTFNPVQGGYGQIQWPQGGGGAQQGGGGMGGQRQRPRQAQGGEGRQPRKVQRMPGASSGGSKGPNFDVGSMLAMMFPREQQQ